MSGNDTSLQISGPGLSAKGRFVTLKDVACEAKVHFTTVSMALRGSPLIAEATRDRILKTAIRMGYRRDPVFLALTARRKNSNIPRARPVIVFLTNRTSLPEFNNTAHMRCFYAGAKAQAEEMGYECKLILVGDRRLSESSIEAHLQSIGAKGLILGAFMPHLRQISLDWNRYAIVKIDSWFMEPKTTVVANDQMHSVMVALEHLHALGYRKPGLAVGRFDEEGSNNLLSSGYLLQGKRFGFPQMPPLCFDYHADSHVCAKKLSAWIRKNRFDVVVSNWGNIQEMIEASGRSVPEDMACACLCLSEPDPFLAGTIQNHTMVGRKAAETVALLIKSRQLGVPELPSSTTIETHWSAGPSSPQRPISL